MTSKRSGELGTRSFTMIFMLRISVNPWSENKENLKDLNLRLNL